MTETVRARPLRLGLEVLGIVLYLAAHVPLALVYILGTLLPVPPFLYWATVAAGYAAMVAIAVARPGPLRGISARRALDVWLLSAAPALAVTAALLWAQWPLAFPSWDAHGFGASGGEANAVLFPWLHAILWILGSTWRRP